VNLFDLAVLLLLVLAAVAGYRIGLVARALSWVGLVIGLVIAARLLPLVLDRVVSSQPGNRLLIALAVLLGGALGGQALGLALGGRASSVLPHSSRPLDRVAGGVVGGVGVLVAVWLLLPAMADVQGGAARLVRDSSIARAIHDVAPDPPDAVSALRELVDESGIPRVFDDLRRAPDAGPPPAASGIAPEVLQRAAASTVRVEGEACGKLQEGSGWVAAPGLVVTNAHVVAGEDETVVLPEGRDDLDATVVAFDAARDLALRVVPELDRPPLPLVDADRGDVGAVLGHPGGGPLEVSPFEVVDQLQAQGRDLYDEQATLRSVLVLASELAPGDSGAPLIDTTGSVVGVAFAIAPDRRGTAYALDPDEVRSVLASRGNRAVDTGPCL
jgi:S1-C subfamily serine protease